MNFRNYGDFNMNMSLLSLLYILPHILFTLMENGYVAEMARTIGAKVCSTYDDFATELNIILSIVQKAMAIMKFSPVANLLHHPLSSHSNFKSKSC